MSGTILRISTELRFSFVPINKIDNYVYFWTLKYILRKATVVNGIYVVS